MTGLRLRRPPERTCGERERDGERDTKRGEIDLAGLLERPDRRGFGERDRDRALRPPPPRSFSHAMADLSPDSPRPRTKPLPSLPTLSFLGEPRRGGGDRERERE